MQLSLLDCLDSKELYEWCDCASGHCKEGGFFIPMHIAVQMFGLGILKD